jgi:hypothetical protein
MSRIVAVILMYRRHKPINRKRSQDNISGITLE